MRLSGVLSPWPDYLVFDDIEDKLDAACRVHALPTQGPVQRVQLVQQYGRKGNLMKWMQMLNSDCPKRDALQLRDRCDLICPDLPKAL